MKEPAAFLNAAETKADGYKSVANRLRRDGIVFFSGLTSSIALEIVHRFGPVYNHRDADPTGITWIETADGELPKGYAGFSEEGLFPHTDRSIEPQPPSHLLFWVEQSSATGGATTLCDGREIYAKLQANRPDALMRLKQPGSAVFQSDGRFLASSIFDDTVPDRVRVRFRRDRLLHVGLDCAEAIAMFINYVEALSTPVQLANGQGYMIDNARWLHGRTHFCGRRRCARLLVESANLASGFDPPEVLGAGSAGSVPEPKAPRYV